MSCCGGWPLSSQFGASSALVFCHLVVRGVYVVGIACKDSRTHLRLSLRWLWGCYGLQFIVSAINFSHLVLLFVRSRGGGSVVCSSVSCFPSFAMAVAGRWAVRAVGVDNIVVCVC